MSPQIGPQGQKGPQGDTGLQGVYGAFGGSKGFMSSSDQHKMKLINEIEDLRKNTKWKFLNFMYLYKKKKILDKLNNHKEYYPELYL